MLDENVTITSLKEDTGFDRLASPCLEAARDALFRWAEVVSSGHLEDLLELYASDAILVPTVSNEIGGQEDERRRYFEAFLANTNLRCKITALKKRISHKLGTVVIGGLYTFTFTRNGCNERLPARFLFTFEEIAGRWLITGHHSSRLPAETDTIDARYKL